MLAEETIRRLILSFGLSQEEIEKLSNKTALLYIKVYHQKKEGNSLVIFRGFPIADTEELQRTAIKSKLSVRSMLSPNITFFCTDKLTDLKTIEKAKSYGSKILRKYEFNLIFANTDGVNDLQDNDFLYDLSVPAELRVAKPLSNFDFTIKVNSFSMYKMDTFYDVNLFKLDCNCDDFREKERNRYAKGDIRRLCRHLMYAYKNNFGVFLQSKFNNYLFENCFPYEKHLRHFFIEKTNQEVVLNFHDLFNWWNIYIEDKDKLYKKYSYSPSQKGFAYNSKPIGIVPQLRAKLDQIYKELTSTKLSSPGGTKMTEPQGCIAVVAFITLIVVGVVFLFS
jgi:hypothetical protein